MPAQSYPRQESFVVAYRVSRLDSPPAPTRAGAIRAPRDERSAECVTDARIQIFIREHDLKNNEGLHAYFNRRVSEILHRHGKRIVGWDAILHPDLPADSIVQASDPGGGSPRSLRTAILSYFPTATISTSTTQQPRITFPIRCPPIRPSNSNSSNTS